MRRSISADQACAIHDETDRQFLNGDVVDDLIVCALQKRRVDGDKWLVSLRRQSCGKRHAMLLGNADVEGAVRKRLGEDVDTGASRHRSSNGNDAIVFFGLLDEALAEYLGVRWCVRHGFV